MYLIVCLERQILIWPYIRWSFQRSSKHVREHEIPLYDGMHLCGLNVRTGPLTAFRRLAGL